MRCPRCRGLVTEGPDGNSCLLCGWYESKQQIRTKEATMAEAKKKCIWPGGCDKEPVARGYCSTHYGKARSDGLIEKVRNQRPRKSTGAGKRRSSSPKQQQPKPKHASNEFKKELRELVRLHDQGAQIVFDVDGRKFTILEVDLTVRSA